MTSDEAVAAASRIEGWMHDDELRWLAEQASSRTRIIEVGSWKGRSTLALALASPGRVFAVDHWLGSPLERDSWHREAVQRGSDAMFAAFCKNTGTAIRTGRLVPIRLPSSMAAEVLGEVLFPCGADMIFIDGAHSYDEVRADIEAYRAICAEGALLCGHDFYAPEDPCARAVIDCLGKDVTLGPKSLWSIIL